MRSWDVPHPYIEWSKTGGIGDMRIELVLYKWEPVTPVVLLEIPEDSQGHFYGLVGSLTLPVCFWVIRQAQVLLHP